MKMKMKRLIDRWLGRIGTFKDLKPYRDGWINVTHMSDDEFDGMFE